jgi:hypothetical protein
MDNDLFVYKSYCELGISSDSVSADEITKKLGIIPFRQFNKGEEFTSKRTGRTNKRIQTVWAIRSEVIVSHDEDVSGHIDYIYALVKDKLDMLKEYKLDPAFTVVAVVWVETDNAGIGFQLREKDLSFLNGIVNRIQFSIITNKIKVSDE